MNVIEQMKENCKAGTKRVEQLKTECERMFQSGYDEDNNIVMDIAKYAMQIVDEGQVLYIKAEEQIERGENAKDAMQMGAWKLDLSEKELEKAKGYLIGDAR